MIDLLIEKYKADSEKVYVTGWSNGGFMTYKLACELSDKISGAAPFVAPLGMFDCSEFDCASSEGNAWMSYWNNDACDFDKATKECK